MTTNGEGEIVRHILFILLLLPVVAGGQELLDWNFDDGTMGPFTPLGPGWDVIDGSLFCHAEDYAFFSSVLAGSPDWNDYTVAFDVRAEGGVNHMLRFRITDFQDYYEVNVRAAPFNDVVIGRMDYLGWQTLASVAHDTQLGVWHHVEVMVEEFTIAVRVDGQDVLVFDDSERPDELRTGSIALVCLSGGYAFWQDVWYDNVTVSTMSVSVASTTLSAVRGLFH